MIQTLRLCLRRCWLRAYRPPPPRFPGGSGTGTLTCGDAAFSVAGYERNARRRRGFLLEESFDSLKKGGSRPPGGSRQKPVTSAYDRACDDACVPLHSPLLSVGHFCLWGAAIPRSTLTLATARLRSRTFCSMKMNPKSTGGIRVEVPLVAGAREFSATRLTATVLKTRQPLSH